ncbi:HAD family hydrolase [Microbacterium sp. Se63.02b]|uniref:HAD family hydrolase n=1 Tax=Microbacterium sp. Se63.02b TaxID=2709304 RepID=UPI001FCEEA26|nr:HAD family hydrolase [Microbacterium sp. Se63.02b]
MLADLGVRTPLDPDAALFSRSFDAVLFDLDGTLVDSTASVIRAWRRFAAHYGVSSDPLHENHGQPARTLIARLLPTGLRAEGLDRILELELADAVALPEVRGARAFYDSIPADRRAVVTSGTAPLATARLRAAGFTTPGVFVTSDDVPGASPTPSPSSWPRTGSVSTPSGVWCSRMPPRESRRHARRGAPSSRSPGRSSPPRSPPTS